MTVVSIINLFLFNLKHKNIILLITIVFHSRSTSTYESTYLHVTLQYANITSIS